MRVGVGRWKELDGKEVASDAGHTFHDKGDGLEAPKTSTDRIHWLGPQQLYQIKIVVSENGT
jgi:hypothetical protein